MKHRHKAIPAVYLILQQNNTTLLLRRSNTGYCDGMFSLPSGHVDKNESIVAAMVREAREEIGIEIDAKDLTLVHIRDRNANDGHRLDFFFTCSTWNRDINNAEPEKCSELYWSKAPQEEMDAIPYIRDVFSRIEHAELHSAEGWNM